MSIAALTMIHLVKKYPWSTSSFLTTGILCEHQSLEVYFLSSSRRSLEIHHSSICLLNDPRVSFISSCSLLIIMYHDSWGSLWGNQRKPSCTMILVLVAWNDYFVIFNTLSCHKLYLKGSFHIRFCFEILKLFSHVCQCFTLTRRQSVRWERFERRRNEKTEIRVKFK